MKRSTTGRIKQLLQNLRSFPLWNKKESVCEKNPTGAVVSANEKKKTATESKMEVRKGTYDKKLKSEREEKDEKQEKMKNGRKE